VTEPKPPGRVELAETESEGDEAYCVACNQSFSLDQMFCPNDGSKLVKLRSTPDQLLGRVFDHRYELRAVLGEGGMGTVYRAWQMSVDREVAIKVIHPKLAAVRAVAKRFLREARLASRLNQANIVNVYDFGQSDDGILYLVMELLRGHPLARELEPRRPLPLRRITTIAAQICDALDAAHGQGIIHRDLKPHNIVLLDEPPGRDLIKILDFGLAKSLSHETTSLVTQTDALLGTPLYMPPEQIMGKPSDARGDLYSLGCILYQMVSGRPPFSGDNLNAVLAMHLQEPAPPLPDTTPPALATLISRLMMKAPEDRPPTAGIVHTAITAIATGTTSPIEALAPRPEAAVSVKRARSPARWIAAIAGAIAIGSVVGITLSRRHDATPTAAPGSAAPGSGSSAAGEQVHDAAIAHVPDDAPPPRPPVDARPAHDARPHHVEPTRPPPDARLPDTKPAPDARAPETHTAPDAGLPDIDLIPSHH